MPHLAKDLLDDRLGAVWVQVPEVKFVAQGHTVLGCLGEVFQGLSYPAGAGVVGVGGLVSHVESMCPCDRG